MSILSYDYYNFSAASNSSNGNAAAAYAQLNGPRTNDSATIGSPSSLTSLSKPNGSSPAGRQSATANTSSSSSSSSSLVALNSPQTSNSTSQTNNGGSSARSTSSNNLLQQLEYNHAFTTASTTANSNTSSAAGALNYHAAGQLSHQLNSNQSPHSQSTNLSTAGHTSIHNAHHHSTSNNSIFSNSHAHHHHHSNSHHHSNTNSNLVLYNNDLPDTKEGLDELCPVCGDKVSEHIFSLVFLLSVLHFYQHSNPLLFFRINRSAATTTVCSRVNLGKRTFCCFV